MLRTNVGFLRSCELKGIASVKRKCGTCQFFEDRGVANSGACLHEQRRDLRDVVLVRQSELACRNSWDQDLWQPAEDLLVEDGPQDSDDVEDSPQDYGAGRREIFGGSETVPTLSPYGPPTDRVTGIALIGASSLRPTGSINPQPEREEEGWRVRPTILEKRKFLEEERRLERERQHALQIAEIEKEMNSRDAIGAPIEVTDAWSGRASNGGLNVSEREQSSPDRDSTGRGPQMDTVPSSQRMLPSRLDGSVWVDPPAVVGESQPTEPLPTDEVRGALQQAAHQAQVDGPFVHVDGRTYGSQTVSQSTPLDETFVQPEPRDPIDQHERLRTMPRSCATCRDFRQVGDSGRGQCVNPYAFSERRMVQSDQLACRSSLGMWWMPNDDVWLERADTSHHGRPTPLLDAAMRAQHAGEAGRDSRP